MDEKIKKLKARIEDQELYVAELLRKEKEAARNHSLEKNELKNLEEQLQKTLAQRDKKWRDLPVTDHAIIRYLERVKGVDIDEIIKEITPEGMLKNVDSIINGRLPHPSGHRLIIANGAVVTIEP
jgi:hypothetical protein